LVDREFAACFFIPEPVGQTSTSADARLYLTKIKGGRKYVAKRAAPHADGPVRRMPGGESRISERRPPPFAPGARFALAPSGNALDKLGDTIDADENVRDF
jgi:hypothetical protein